MKKLLLNLPANRVRRGYIGGAELDRLEGRAAPVDSDRPEDWIASTVEARNPGLAEIAGEGLAFVDGPDGKRLLVKDLFAAEPEHYLGTAHVEQLGTELGFLAKLLDSAMRLHIQAHPTAAFAQKHLNSRWGKLETYYILGKRPGSDGVIWLGFQRPPSEAELRRTVLEQDLAAMHAWFDPIPVEAGQVWVVPGGLPHALGTGLLVMEVMEPTDLVVRCEFEREGVIVPPAARFMGRDPEFALSVFDRTPQTPEQITTRCRVEPQLIREGDGFREDLLIGPDQTDCFVITRLEVAGEATVSLPSHVNVGVVAEGTGVVSAGDERLGLKAGAKFLVAAAVEALTIASTREPLVILLCRPSTPS